MVTTSDIVPQFLLFFMYNRLYVLCFWVLLPLGWCDWIWVGMDGWVWTVEGQWLWLCVCRWMYVWADGYGCVGTWYGWMGVLGWVDVGAWVRIGGCV